MQIVIDTAQLQNIVAEAVGRIQRVNIPFYLSQRQASQHFGLSRDRLRDLTRRGMLVRYVIPGQPGEVYRRDDLEKVALPAWAAAESRRRRA